MPKRTDLHRILVIGSGPIVIGQACEFDYSGTQACKVLRREGFHVSLVNSNPATIMTDPEFANRTYIEPLTPASVLEVIERERPDVLLPTVLSRCQRLRFGRLAPADVAAVLIREHQYAEADAYAAAGIERQHVAVPQ